MDLAIVGMSSIGIDLYLTLKNEVAKIYLIGEENEAGMAINGNKIFLKDDDFNHIIKIVNQNIKNECLVYLTTDIYNDAVMQEYDNTGIWFKDNLKYIGVSYEFHNRIRDKHNYENLLSSYGVNTPQIYNLHSILEDIQLPVFSKYNGRNKENYHYKSKLFIKQNEFEHEIKQDYTASYVYQKYYSPEEYKNYSYGCFVNDGKVLADIFVRQLAQYPKGISTLVMEDINLPIDFINSVKKLLKTEKYNGFIEFEILKGTDNIILIDINLRTWGWFSILNHKYRNFPKIVTQVTRTPEEIKGNNRVWAKYHRLAIGTLAERTFRDLKYIKINKSFISSIYVVSLFIRNGFRGRF